MATVPHPAQRSIAKSRATGDPVAGAGAGKAVGSPATGPAITPSSSRMSATEVPIGPSVEKSIQSGARSRPITPFVGFRPTRPHQPAGILTDPPPSAAVAIGTIPAASAAADPPLEPPGAASRRHGSPVEPNSRFDV